MTTELARAGTWQQVRRVRAEVNTNHTTAFSTSTTAIASLSQIRPTWWEMQRIKNELAGEYATGVEVYPPQHEVVDGANMFHIWILPGPLDFGLQ